MEKLLQPDTGLMFWTIVTFLLLVAVLGKAAWKPIIDGLNKREGKIRSDIERAEASQKEAEALRQRYEKQLADAQKSIQDMVNQARADGETARAKMLADARDEADKVLAKGRKDLTAETERLKDELKAHVTELSLTMAEKVLNKSVDGKLRDEVFKDSLKELSGRRS